MWACGRSGAQLYTFWGGKGLGLAEIGGFRVSSARRGEHYDRIARVLVERERQVNVLPEGGIPCPQGYSGYSPWQQCSVKPREAESRGHCRRCVAAVLDGQAYSECALGRCWLAGGSAPCALRA
jgi:hypothetical protein